MPDKKFWSINESSFKIDLSSPTSSNVPFPVCEKPYLSTFGENDFIYPLGGNLRGFFLKEFLRRESVSEEYRFDLGVYGNVNPLCRKSAPFLTNAFTESGYSLVSGSNWMGSFSISSSKNGNLIGPIRKSDFSNISEDKVTLGQRTIFKNLFDRVHITDAGKNGGTKFSYTFRDLTSGEDYCFSCYIRSTLPNIVHREVKVVNDEGNPDTSVELFASDDIVDFNEKLFKVKDTYTKIVIRKKVSGTSWTLKLKIGDGVASDVDMCGFCFSKGRFPIEPDSRENNNLYCPLIFDPALSGSWTVKYKRFVIGTDSNQFYDWVGGYKIPYPAFPGEVEFVTIRSNNGTLDCKVCSNKNPTYESISLTEESISNVGGVIPTILLGGHMENSTFCATPGLYRDLMVFHSYLDDTVINQIDKFLMGVTFVNGSSFLRNSLFKEETL